MHLENSTKILDSFEKAQISVMSISLPFCFNTLVVLVYYIRRRVKLHLEKRRLVADQLVIQEYKNYFMNLKITITITNLIILILILELVENLLLIQDLLAAILRHLIPGLQADYLTYTTPYVSTLLYAIRLTYVPLLSLVMNFLWLVYRKYKYKYTMIRWTVYIVMRGCVVCIWFQLLSYIDNDYWGLASTMLYIFIICNYIFDFIQYVYYSKRFYSHLKSREKEIRLFYFDKEAHIRSRWIRKHFFVGNILVTNALFIFTFGYSIFAILSVVYRIARMFDRQSSSTVGYVTHSLDSDIFFPLLVVYKVLLNLNYLYIITVLAYKSIRGRIKLYNVNKHIKPIVKVYHESVYNNSI